MQHTQHLIGLVVVTHLRLEKHLLKFPRQSTPILLAIGLQQHLQHMKESVDTPRLFLKAFQVVTPVLSRRNQILFRCPVSKLVIIFYNALHLPPHELQPISGTTESDVTVQIHLVVRHHHRMQQTLINGVLRRIATLHVILLIQVHARLPAVPIHQSLQKADDGILNIFFYSIYVVHHLFTSIFFGAQRYKISRSF